MGVAMQRHTAHDREPSPCPKFTLFQLSVSLRNHRAIHTSAACAPTTVQRYEIVAIPDDSLRTQWPQAPRHATRPRDRASL
jgi:hypothetical protein